MQVKRDENKINEVISSAMKNLNGLIDVNTVVGKPIKATNNDYIIPISKVTFGILGGGGEYGKINVLKKDSKFPYSAGNGAIVSINPCGFLIKKVNGEYQILSISKNSYQTILDKTADIIKENFLQNEK